MGTGFHGGFGNTQGTKTNYEKVIENLPQNPKLLMRRGWKEITPPAMSKYTTSKMYLNSNLGLTIRFDKGKKGISGYAGKDHYHILNPNSSGKHDYYLDKNGNPVPKNSKASHIIAER